MSFAIGVSWGLALVLFAVAFCIRRQRRIRSKFTTPSGSIARPPKRTAMPNASEVLVYINEDGSVRELTEADKKYVDTEFSPFDGARPYIKLRYSQRTALGEIRGYLPRTEVPEGMAINPAPSQHEPEHQTLETVAESISKLIRKHTQN
jgi:hypothetical protein